MTTVTITNSLTRMHKIASRANDTLSKLQSEITKLIGARGTSINDKDADFAKANTDLEKARTLKTQAQEVSRAIVTIRSALAKANAEGGVAQHLAEIEGLKREIAIEQSFIGSNLERFGDIERTTVVFNRKEDEAKSVEGRATGVQAAELLERASAIRAQTVNFRALSDADIESGKSEVEALGRKIVSLTDKLADLNGTRISVVISKTAADAIGIEL